MQTFNIYCDESCHLENDHQATMVLGAVWCPKEKARGIAVRIREIKKKHGLNDKFEIKWKKVSPGKEKFYLELIDYFFDDDDLHFRAWIVPDKSILRHREFNKDHDEFYYKMYYDMLKLIINPKDRYNIYIDIKDTNSYFKAKKLHDVLSHSKYDFSRTIIQKLEHVRSHEVEQIQLADLLIGSISYLTRNIKTSASKLEIIERIRERSGYRLTQSTLYREEKFNICYWRAS